MQANANLNGLFGFGDDAALAAVIAAKSAHNDNIKIIGFDGMKEARDAVDSEKTFAAVIRQYPIKWVLKPLMPLLITSMVNR